MAKIFEICFFRQNTTNYTLNEKSFRADLENAKTVLAFASHKKLK
jgi:hypothetical protein